MIPDHNIDNDHDQQKPEASKEDFVGKEVLLHSPCRLGQSETRSMMEGKCGDENSGRRASLKPDDVTFFDSLRDVASTAIKTAKPKTWNERPAIKIWFPVLGSLCFASEEPIIVEPINHLGDGGNDVTGDEDAENCFGRERRILPPMRLIMTLMIV